MGETKRIPRAPRRRVVDERRVCQRYGGAVVTTIVCVLDCGHVVEGTAGWGRRACRQCKEASHAA